LHMNNKTIDALAALGAYIASMPPELEEKIEEAFLHNRWFTPENTRFALASIAQSMLQREKMEDWLAHYPGRAEPKIKNVGLIMAGNLPLVGFHDLLSVLLSGHRALIKLSSKDRILLPFLLEKLETFDARIKDCYAFVERLRDFDAVIATGSNNSARYFEYYFGRYPHIIRKNRNSVAVITGDENENDLRALGDDIFRYFGMGCRNVSKLYLPEGYDPARILEAMEVFREIIHHDKYRNNYDYHRSLYLLNRTPHLASDFLMLVENEAIASPMATLHYEYYRDKSSLKAALAMHRHEIQIVVSKDPETGNVAPGCSQSPGLLDYADKVDTMAFLVQL